MEHPLISNIDHLTVEELQSKITELNKKMMFAQRSGNAALAGQISMALETFRNKYQEKVRELYDKHRGDGKDFSDRIDIS